MKPIRLTVQAFGPFAGKEVIDFTQALNAGLFGIYGQTGAGKSSIFSAMTFALFGQTLRSGQKPYSLRSDQADPALPTQVELVFEIGEKRYVVRRIPDQTRPKMRGEGDTKIAAEAHLFDATEYALADLTETQHGKVLVEKKVKDVGQAIQDLLGYGLDQFRQIVLLPQGQFEKFLSANTKERGEILEDLFDVSVFESLSTRLREQARGFEDRVRTERDVCDGRLRAEGFETNNALEVGIEEADQHRATAEAQEAAARAQRDAAADALARQRTLDQAFDAAAKAQHTLATLESQSAAMAELALRVSQAEKARTVLDAEKAALDAVAHAQDAARRREDGQDRLENTQRLEVKAQAALASERERAEELTAMRRESDDFNRYQKTLVSAQVDQQRAEQARQEAQKSNAALEEARAAYRVLKDRHNQQSKTLERADRTEKERTNLTGRLQTLRQKIAEAEAFGRQQTEITALEVRRGEAEDALSQHQETAAKAKGALQTATERLTSNHALVLAAHLAPDTPCPVCGSREHPAPRTRPPEEPEDELDLAPLQTAYDTALQRVQETAGKVEGAIQLLDDKRQSLNRMTPPAEDLSTLQARETQWRQELSDLGDAVDLEVLKTALSALAQEMEQAEEHGQRLSQLHTTKGQEASALAATLRTKLADIPEDMHDPAALTAAQERLAQTLDSRQKALAAAETNHQSAREAMVEATERLKGLDDALETARRQANIARTAFEQRLDAEGLSEERLADLKADVAEIDTHRGTVERHHAALKSAQDRVAETTAEIDDKVRPDLATATTLLQEAEAALTAAVDQRAKNEEAHARLLKLKTEIEEKLTALLKLEADTAPLRTLAALCNGDNAQKMDLKTFAIAAFFDRVLDAANQRFYPMSGHRYRLERETEIRGGGRKGLELQVSDAHTGKPRSTATLSGGETFIAALALALGLADTVESASGKVRLDTIFIDEGFGSLDTENGAGTLDQVLQTLTDLVSQNRAVGLISHVPMVQETIPNGFYVRKHPGGSTVETRDGA